MLVWLALPFYVFFAVFDPSPNFMNKFCVSNDELCKIFTDRAKKELATLLAYIQLSLVK